MTNEEYEAVFSGGFPSGDDFTDVHKFLAAEDGFYSQEWNSSVIHEDIAEAHGVEDEVLGGGMLEVDDGALRLYGDSATYGGVEHNDIEGVEDEIVAAFEEEYGVEVAGLVLESDEEFRSQRYVEQKLRDAGF
ncbi:MAG: hypothetical protein ABEJ98_00445 [Candidatus Nanohaloarchaea archaeon]